MEGNISVDALERNESNEMGIGIWGVLMRCGAAAAALSESVLTEHPHRATSTVKVPATNREQCGPVRTTKS